MYYENSLTQFSEAIPVMNFAEDFEGHCALAIGASVPGTVTILVLMQW